MAVRSIWRSFNDGERCLSDDVAPARLTHNRRSRVSHLGPEQTSHGCISDLGAEQALEFSMKISRGKRVVRDGQDVERRLPHPRVVQRQPPEYGRYAEVVRLREFQQFLMGGLEFGAVEVVGQCAGHAYLGCSRPPFLQW